MKLRILLGFVSYGPYHLARLQACREVLVDWEVTGWELSSDQSEYAWDHASSNHLRTVTKFPLESVGLCQWWRLVWRSLNELRPDVCVLAGYAHPGMLAALFWCRFHRRGCVIMSDSKEDDAPRKGWMEWVKGRLLNLYDAALVAGAPHQRYFLKLGMQAKLIFTGYDVVDNELYGQPQRLPDLRRPYFVVISRFVPKKNLHFLLKAYKSYINQVGEAQAWSLVICGDGPMKEMLKAEIRELQLEAFVKLTGFLQTTELLPYLVHARALVHASIQEQWGLVVNEAMAAGLPVIVSRGCGCFEDLVQEGVNGFGFDACNLDDLQHKLLILHHLPEPDRRVMGLQGKRWIQASHSLRHFAEGVGGCVRLAQKA